MKRILKLLPLLLIISLLFSLVSCEILLGEGEGEPYVPVITIPGEEESNLDSVPEVPVAKDGEISIHFIDVDQADAALILDGDKVMLIDAGDYPNDKHKEYMLKYLKDRGVETIDYLVLTHAHGDHIGGAPEVINTFDVKNCIMSKQPYTSDTFGRTLDALENKNVNVIAAEPGDTYTLGTATFEILGAIKEKYKDVNDSSVVLRLDFGQRSVLFTGDAETVSEAEMVEKYKGTDKLDADVLKVGHHGSGSSTSQDFLSMVSPGVAIISCGNEYGHPHQTVMNRLAGARAEILRTDKHGTIVMITDGEEMAFTCLTKAHKETAKN